ncbi:hypothetical protein BZM26_37880 [Paraburkholderia strydomiana]|nr:hypothetical protein BZM26_37880 [Paraburkholderia strydomiana]
MLAQNGHDALAKATSHFPEVVITDLQMPEMDGRELCRRLKCAPVLTNIAIVSMSAMPEPPDAIRYWTTFSWFAFTACRSERT